LANAREKECPACKSWTCQSGVPALAPACPLIKGGMWAGL